VTPEDDVIKAELFTSTDEIRIYVLSRFNVCQTVINISSFTLSMCFTLAPDYEKFCAYIHRCKNVILGFLGIATLNVKFCIIAGKNCTILHEKYFVLKISCYNCCLALFIEVSVVRIIRTKNCRGNAGNIFGSQHSLQS
jgi:hypothetical protein